MSGPTTLTVFSPFTPLIASSTLSAITCEKLKTTPGNADRSAVESSSVSLSFVIPLRHTGSRLERREELDVVEARPASVPSSGRPSCETTVAISGRRRRSAVHASSGRAPEDEPPHAAHVLRRLVERDRHRQGGANPEVPLLQLGHELAAQGRAEQPGEEHRNRPPPRWPSLCGGWRRRTAAGKRGRRARITSWNASPPR